MKKLYLLLFVSVFFQQSLKAQNYWQQKVDYKIEVSLDDVNHFLKGTIEINYTNNSPKALPYIYFHLWPNAYKDNNTEFAKQQILLGRTDFYFAKESDRGFMDNIKFMVDGKQGNFLYNEDTIDIGRLMLDKPLQPNQTIKITTPFRVKIPKTFSRLGHDGQQYQISQWFPKPAVYDKNGWNQMPYLDQGEFYSEYGSFDVKITLPKNYVVGATGELQNEDEKIFMDTLAARTATYDGFVFDKNFPKSNDTTKTLHYIANNVHDFAWFADKRYVALKGNVTLERGRTVNTWLLFTPRGGRYWKNALPYINHAVEYYSKWIGEYPYNNVTAVEGKLEAGGGMEYPMVTVIGKVQSSSMLETVIVHEVGHNWFQGILGSNERMHPWMDEGINSYYENRYTKEIAAAQKPSVKKSKGVSFSIGDVKDKNGNSLTYLGYAFSAWKNEDQPCELPSVEYTPINYFGDVYAKTPLVFNYFANTIGQQTFDSIMHLYFAQFKFKHPQPDDIKNVFNQNTKQNIDWFWNDAIGSTKKFDLRLKNINRTIEKIGNAEFLKVTVKNESNVRTPYSISALRNDSIISTINYGGFLGEMDVLFPVGNYNKLIIDANHDIPELNRQNNASKINGNFRKTEPLKLGGLGILKLPNRNQIAFAPTMGYNNYNGLMPGIVIANPFLPGNKWSYQLLPLIGLKKASLAFTGKITRNWNIENSFINNIKAGVGANAFDMNFETEKKYVRLRPFVDFNIKNPHPSNGVKQKISVESFIIRTGDVNQFTIENFSKQATVKHFVATYSYSDDNKIAPQKFNIQAQHFNNNYKFTTWFETGLMYKKNKYFKARGFAGIVSNAKTSYGYHLQLTGFNGFEDYLYNNMYLGRNESDGILSKQLYIQEGGFRQRLWHQDFKEYSNLFLSSLNFTFDLPTKLPLALYTDIGMYSLKQPLRNESDKIQYAGGLIIKISENFQINLPLFASRDFRENINTVYGSKSKWHQYTNRITFIFNINEMNPVSMAQNFKVN